MSKNRNITRGVRPGCSNGNGRQGGSSGGASCSRTFMKAQTKSTATQRRGLELRKIQQQKPAWCQQPDCSPFSENELLIAAAEGVPPEEE